MRKAIYVEGLSEMAFVYQMLLTHFDMDWTQVHVSCVNLKNIETTPKPADYGAEDAPNQYLLRNVGNDESVSSMLLEGYEHLKNAGYDQVIGLRDVYGENYKSLYQCSLDKNHIEQFMTDIRESLYDFLGNDARLHLHFAVMEVESWLLDIAKKNVFQQLDENLKLETIKGKLSVDLGENIEYGIFHPAVKLSEILSSVGLSYSKHWDDIKSIVFKLEKEDFEELYYSQRSLSYSDFYHTVFDLTD